MAIKLARPGPVLFRQERLGLQGRPFTMLKFRSMRVGAEAGGVYESSRDARVTRVGRVLRRTSLDELPQLLNIIRGDMSLVGPRPPIAYEIENYQPWHMERLKAVPGLTGLWQISGRSSVSFDEMVRLDIRYINEWSFRRDLAIIAKTVPVVFRGTGGY